MHSVQRSPSGAAARRRHLLVDVETACNPIPSSAPRMNTTFRWRNDARATVNRRPVPSICPAVSARRECRTARRRSEGPLQPAMNGQPALRRGPLADHVTSRTSVGWRQQVHNGFRRADLISWGAAFLNTISLVSSPMIQ